MEQSAKKLWNRDFLLVLLSQIISIFGNGVIRFALPLYILHMSGDAALFGLVGGLSAIPLIIMTPIGGAIADRLRKQRIMLGLDAITTAIIVLYMIVSGMFALVPAAIVMLMMLGAIQGIYSPTVDASVPVIVPADKLVQANSAVMGVHTVSSLGAPAIAGILVGRLGIFSVLITGAVCFAITTVVDLFIRIPQKQHATEGIKVRRDISQAFKFVAKEKPNIVKCAAAVFLPALAINGSVAVGLPVLITQHLGMSMQQMGMSQSIIVGGMLAGSIVAGALGSRLTVKKVPMLMIFAGILLIPSGLVFLLGVPHLMAYIIITATLTVTLAAMQIMFIPVYAFVQTETPIEIVGKVISLITMIPAVAGALGQLIFGVLYKEFAESPYIVIVITVLLIVVTAVFSRGTFKRAFNIV